MIFFDQKKNYKLSGEKFEDKKCKKLFQNITTKINLLI